MAGDYYKWLGIICFKNVYNKIYNKDKTNSLRKKNQVYWHNQKLELWTQISEQIRHVLILVTLF